MLPELQSFDPRRTLLMISFVVLFGKGAAHIGDAASVLKGGTVVWSIEQVLDLDRFLYPSSRRAAT